MCCRVMQQLHSKQIRVSNLMSEESKHSTSIRFKIKQTAAAISIRMNCTNYIKVLNTGSVISSSVFLNFSFRVQDEMDELYRLFRG